MTATSENFVVHQACARTHGDCWLLIGHLRLKNRGNCIDILHEFCRGLGGHRETLAAIQHQRRPVMFVIEISHEHTSIANNDDFRVTSTI